MTHIESLEQFNDFIKEGVSLVDFYATWCGPCRMLSPIVEETESEYKDKVKFAKLDVDDLSEIAAQYAINAIPALLFFKDGQLLEKSVGFVDKEELVSIINSILAK